MAELTIGSNAPPSDSTNPLDTMQHKSGTGLAWQAQQNIQIPEHVKNRILRR